MLFGVLAEGLLLGVHPVFIEAALDVVVELGGPDGLECAQSTRSLDVTNHTNDLHWGALKDRAGMDDVLLDDLLTFTSFLVLNNVGHAGLVTDEGSEVDWLGSVVAGERSYSAAVVLCSALRNESHVAMARLLVFTMRHLFINNN